MAMCQGAQEWALKCLCSWLCHSVLEWLPLYLCLGKPNCNLQEVSIILFSFLVVATFFEDKAPSLLLLYFCDYYCGCCCEFLIPLVFAFSKLSQPIASVPVPSSLEGVGRRGMAYLESKFLLVLNHHTSIPLPARLVLHCLLGPQPAPTLLTTEGT